MDHQHRRNLIRRENEESWHESNPEISKDSSYDHRVTHTALYGDIVGHDAHIQLGQQDLDAFSRHRMGIDHLVVEGDHAVSGTSPIRSSKPERLWASKRPATMSRPW